MPTANPEALTHPALLGQVASDFRRTWPQLALTDLLAKAIGFVLLGVVFSPLLGMFLMAADHRVLSDEEILFFFVRPWGLLALLVGGSVWVGMVFAKQSCLMVVAMGATLDRQVSYVQALRYAGRRAPELVRLAGRMLARVLLVAAPFLAASGLVYLALLTEHDINYYLMVRPRAFWIAALGIGTLLGLLGLLLARWAVTWLFALPELLFESLGPGDALRASERASRGRRALLAGWIAAWALASLAASSILTALLGGIARLLIPTGSGSLTRVALGIGAALVVVAIHHLAISLLASAGFALLVVRLYRRHSGPGTLVDDGIAPPGSLGPRPALRVPRQGLVWGALGIAVVIGLLAVLAINLTPTEDDLSVAAHRGASGEAPENTMAAVRRAIAEGSDWVEIDVQESADGVVVVNHDEDFMKLAGVTTKVWQGTFAELEQIDVGLSFGEAFRGERVATLEQVLLASKGKIRVLIELKYYGHDQQLEQRVVDLVESTGMVGQVAIMSLKYAGVQKTRQLRPDWTYGLLAAVAVGDLTRLEVDFLAVNAEMASRRFIRHAHRRGKQVYVWTVNDPVQMSVLTSRGADAVITNWPGRARAVLRQRAGMSPVERLIVEFGAAFGLIEGIDESSDASDA